MQKVEIEGSTLGIDRDADRENAFGAAIKLRTLRKARLATVLERKIGIGPGSERPYMQSDPIEQAVDFFLEQVADYIISPQVEPTLLSDSDMDRRLEKAGIHIGREDHPKITAGLYEALVPRGEKVKLVDMPFSYRRFYAAILDRNTTDASSDLKASADSLIVTHARTVLDGHYLERITRSPFPGLHNKSILHLVKKDSLQSADRAA
jgi:hypothetical protein